MKLLIDMNLWPQWCEVLKEHGREAIHWSAVGEPTAPDADVMLYPRENGYVLFTHDLDFSALLASTRADGPSVIQVRAQDTLSTRFRDLLVGALGQFEKQLDAGAIVVIEEFRARARALPIRDMD